MVLRGQTDGNHSIHKIHEIHNTCTYYTDTIKMNALIQSDYSPNIYMEIFKNQPIT